MRRALMTVLTYDRQKRAFTITSEDGVFRHLSPAHVVARLNAPLENSKALMRVARDFAPRSKEGNT